MNRDRIISLFYDVLKDVRDFLPGLTLVGGWLPFIYSNYLWHITVRNPITTVDIDFGVDQSDSIKISRTIYETLSSLKYRERHLKMDRNFPVVLCKETIPVEFITYPAVDTQVIDRMVGREIQINKIDKFDFLLKHRSMVDIQFTKNDRLTLNCPKPSAFLFHKAATFIGREYREKQAKDLYYIYYILRFAPDISTILSEVSEYAEKGFLKGVRENLNLYFERISSQGCLLIEGENGPDEILQDVRQDIFDRFERLRGALEKKTGYF